MILTYKISCCKQLHSMYTKEFPFFEKYIQKYKNLATREERDTYYFSFGNRETYVLYNAN